MSQAKKPAKTRAPKRATRVSASEPRRRRVRSPVGVLTLAVSPLSTLGGNSEEPHPGRLAAIDLGSNSLHMIIVEADPAGGYRVLDREKEMVCLGGALKLDGKPAPLPASAVEASLETLSRFLALASLRGASEAVAVATSAVREAADGSDFLARVKAQTGLQIRLLSGDEEGYLVFRAVREALDLSEPRCVIADLGGGSTEWIRVEKGELKEVKSLPLGSLRLAQILEDAPPSGAAMADLRKVVGRGLRSLGHKHVDRLVATSGTALTVASLSELISGRPWRAAAGTLRALTASDVDRVIETLLKLTRKEIAALPPVGSRRAVSILSGAILLRELLAASGCTELTVCDRSLRYGLVLATLSRAPERAGSSRRRQVERLARRVESVYAHSVQCARLAVRLFDLTMAIHGLGQREREWLEYAALLHDIGYSVHHRRHQDHSRYLIANAGLSGFEREELEVMAVTAGYHRGHRPRSNDPELKSLSHWQRKVIKRLVALLRLGDALDRTHASRVENLYCAIRKRKLRFDVISPYDVTLELEAARKAKRQFERIFGVEVRLQQGFSPARRRRG